MQQHWIATGAGELIADKVIGILGDNRVTILLTFVIFILCCADKLHVKHSNHSTDGSNWGIYCTGHGSRSESRIMACVIGGSCAYATPIGMPANTMVVTAGGYKFKDYVKSGLPMILVATVVSMILLPIFYPFFPRIESL